MSTRGPMQVSTSGVVFYYDIANDKSYLGEPTTNFYTNADLTGGNNVGQEGGSNPTNEVVLFPNPGNSPYCVRSTAVGGSIYTEYQLTVTGTIQANTSYTLSCWVAWTPDWDGTYSVFHMRWYNSGGSEAGSSGLEQGTTIETRVVNGLTWYRKYYTFNSGASVNGTHDWYAGYYSNNTKGYRYFTNFQLEAKNHPTQFSKGTRSVTTGLVDLIGNYEINLTNAGYDSNANITFNGSSNYITAYTIPDSFWNAGSWSVSVWIKFNSVSKGTDNAIFGHGAGSYSNGLHLAERSSAVYFGFYANDLAGTIPLAANKWYNIVWVFNYSTKLKQIYVNGVFDTSGGSVGYSGTGTNTEFGRYPWSTGNLTNSTISSIYGYNKVLTASEVLQNYNRTKSRFGL